MRSLETLTDIFFEANPPPNVDSLHIISKHLTNRSVSVQNVQMRITVFTQTQRGPRIWDRLVCSEARAALFLFISGTSSGDLAGMFEVNKWSMLVFPFFFFY